MMIETALTLEQLVQTSREKFQSYYGRQPRWVVAAPGRVNIIGEHTDYNGGFVFPMGIERYTVLAADAPRSSNANKLNIRCMRFNESACIDLKNLVKGQPSWSNYIRGVILGYHNRGIDLPPLDVAMYSNIPAGGGLSSSAALEVGTGTLIEAVTGKALSLQDKALIGQKAEHDFAGVPCGIMDQFISAMARKDGIMLLDCCSYETRWVTVTAPDVSFLIINSNVKHQLASGEYAKRRAECETAARTMGVDLLRDATMEQLESFRNKMSDVPYRRARHVISENERTLKTADALEKGQLEETGKLMFASHRSLSADFEVSCAELDCIVDTARSIGLAGGVYGCRMTGGGFGGCAIALVKTAAIQKIVNTIETTYAKTRNLRCPSFQTRPALGAQIIEAN